MRDRRGKPQGALQTVYRRRETVDRRFRHRKIGVRQIVAEGVERPEDLAFLGQAGCDAVQGYLVARPMQFEKLQSFVEEFNQAFGVRSTIPSPSAMPAAFG